MQGSRLTCVCIVAGALLVAPSSVSAQTPDSQALRQEIEQLRKEFETIQKQYGDRLTALESKLSATEPAPQPAGPLRKHRRNRAASPRQRRRFRPAPKAPEVRPVRCRCTAVLQPRRRSSTRTWPSSATFWVRLDATR